MTRHRRTVVTLGLVSVVLVACSSGGKKAPATYRPRIDPARFTDQITARYFPLQPGTVYLYRGASDGEARRDEVTVTHDTKLVMGVRCVVVHDVAFVKNRVVEETFDWYAQDTNGSVWYFGEDTKEYDSHGEVTSTAGSWEGGRDGAQPGIIMLAHPAVGRTYRQEFYRGHAEDMATVLDVAARLTVPAGAYQDVVVTKDFSPLQPDTVEHKSYAPEVGIVAERTVKGGNERLELVRIEHN